MHRHALGGGLGDAVANFGRRLKDTYDDAVFTSSQALDGDPLLNNKSKVNEYLRELERAGVTELVTPAKGAKPAEWRVVNDVPDGACSWLPTVDADGRFSRGS